MPDLITHNEFETKLLGRKLAKSLKSGTILLLSGNLGSGKTTFVKGLGAGLGIKKLIRSPSFTLMNHYILNKRKGLKNFIHVDCYRMNNPKEIIDIGLLDYLGKSQTIVAIEWPERIKFLLKNFKTKRIKFSHLKNNVRKIRI